MDRCACLEVIMGGHMRTLKKIVTTLLVMATIFSLFGCSGNGIFSTETKSDEEYRKEATEISMRLAKKIMSSDYDTVASFTHNDDNTPEYKEAILNMETGLVDDVMLVIEEVDMDDKSHTANVHFRASINFSKTFYTSSFVMKMVYDSGHWYINNAQAVVSDIRSISQSYKEGKKSDND